MSWEEAYAVFNCGARLEFICDAAIADAIIASVRTADSTHRSAVTSKTASNQATRSGSAVRTATSPTSLSQYENSSPFSPCSLAVFCTGRLHHPVPADIASWESQPFQSFSFITGCIILLMRLILSASQKQPIACKQANRLVAQSFRSVDDPWR